MGSSGTGGPQGFRIYCLGCLSCRYLTGRFLSRIRCFPLFLITTDPGLRLSRMTATGNDRPQKFPLSFPRAVVGNLLCPLFPSCVTTDPRQKRSGMTATKHNKKGCYKNWGHPEFSSGSTDWDVCRFCCF